MSGYVRQWYKDIGAHVKAGEVLATIDTPELDQRLAEAREQLTKAKANQALAAVTADRWKSLRQSGAVSQQAADEKVADAAAKDAEVAAASANVDRLKALKAFANIVAPFDGVVTAAQRRYRFAGQRQRQRELRPFHRRRHARNARLRQGAAKLRRRHARTA